MPFKNYHHGRALDKLSATHFTQHLVKTNPDSCLPRYWNFSTRQLKFLILKCLNFSKMPNFILTSIPMTQEVVSEDDQFLPYQRTQEVREPFFTLERISSLTEDPKLQVTSSLKRVIPAAATPGDMKRHFTKSVLPLNILLLYASGGYDHPIK